MTGRKVLFLGVLVALGLFGGGGTAQAADRKCVGAIGPETVRGNLVVPEGATCELAGTRVRGNVFVREEAALFAEEAEIRGNIEADSLAFVGFDLTEVRGSVVLRSSIGLFVIDSSIDGNVDSTDSEFASLSHVSVGGNVKMEGAATQVFSAFLQVGGTLEALGVGFFDLFDSTVNGNFYVRATRQGSLFCGNTLNGDSEFTDSAGLLVIGSDAAGCSGNRVNGNVLVERNTAETDISFNEINGNLSCFDNAPPPVGAANVVRGNREGQCAAFEAESP